MPQVEFSTDTIGYQNFLAEDLSSYNLIPAGAKINPGEFTTYGSIFVTVATGGAAISAVSIPITALAPLEKVGTAILPIGVVLIFGVKKFAILTAPALAGDTAITVQAIPTALVATDSANYSPGHSKPIQAGLLVGRTFAERDSSTPYGVADVAADTDIYLIGVGCQDANINPEIVLLRHQTLIYENRLPGWAAMTAPQKAKVRSLYECITSAN
jgi:hypothetical protein